MTSLSWKGKSLAATALAAAVSASACGGVGPGVHDATDSQKPKGRGSSDEYLVSALVPTYNAGRFMRGLLEDLEAQTMADRMEIVIADTGSPTNEKEIVQEFQKKYDNIVYLRTEHRESSHSAINRCIKAARGKYVTLACTDDRHKEDALERMVAVLESRPDVALVYGNTHITVFENETFDNFTPAGTYRWAEFDPQLLLQGGSASGRSSGAIRPFRARRAAEPQRQPPRERLRHSPGPSDRPGSDPARPPRSPAARKGRPIRRHPGIPTRRPTIAAAGPGRRHLSFQGRRGWTMTANHKKSLALKALKELGRRLEEAGHTLVEAAKTTMRAAAKDTRATMRIPAEDVLLETEKRLRKARLKMHKPAAPPARKSARAPAPPAVHA